jgi:hypothetical protein
MTWQSMEKLCPHTLPVGRKDGIAAVDCVYRKHFPPLPVISSMKLIRHFVPNPGMDISKSQYPRACSKNP